MEEIDFENVIGCCICGKVIDFVKVVEENFFEGDDDEEDDDDFEVLDEEMKDV